MKSRIIAAGGKVRYYDAAWDCDNKKITGLETLGKYIEEDLKKLLLKDLKQNNILSLEERHLRYFDMHYSELS